MKASGTSALLCAAVQTCWRRKTVLIWTVFGCSLTTLNASGTLPNIWNYRKVIGAVGVIGPTRLNYGRIVPIVDYTAKLIGKMISDDGESLK